MASKSHSFRPNCTELSFRLCEDLEKASTYTVLVGISVPGGISVCLSTYKISSTYESAPKSCNCVTTEQANIGGYRRVVRNNAHDNWQAPNRRKA